MGLLLLVHWLFCRNGIMIFQPLFQPHHMVWARIFLSFNMGYGVRGVFFFYLFWIEFNRYFVFKVLYFSIFWFSLEDIFPTFVHSLSL